jgi:cytochrome c oxidase assembly protein subunit 15
MRTWRAYHRTAVTAPRLPHLTPRAYQRVTLFALVALAVIIVTGAAVRLTGSGLGCSDWPTCENDKLVAPLEYHAMVEFVNRLFTGLVSVAVILAVLGSLVRVPRRRDLTWWSLGLVAGVVAQIVLGGVVVLLHLSPVSVIGHFLVSIALVWNAVVLHERAGHSDEPGTLVTSPRLRDLGRVLVALAGIALFTGTLVTATGPHGGDERAERLMLFDISEIARVHGSTVIAFLCIALATLWMAHRTGSSLQTERRAWFLVGAILVQAAIGYTQYFNGVPPWLVGLHVAGAVVVWIATLRLYLSFFAYPAEGTAGADAAGALGVLPPTSLTGSGLGVGVGAGDSAAGDGVGGTPTTLPSPMMTVESLPSTDTW